MHVWRPLVSFICLTVIMGGFQNCAPVHEDMKGASSLLSGGSQDPMLEKFSTTLHPTLRANCAACHGVSQSPMFAVADPMRSMETIFQNDLVDLNSPPNSWFVQKILGGHNSFPSSLANKIQNDIQLWADALDPVDSPADEPSAPTPTPTPDTSAPSVMINSPATGANIKNSVVISAIASDDTGVAGVQFYVDGVALGSEDTSSPYSIDWNVSSLANRSYSIRARARDAAGNTTNSVTINVNVDNDVSNPVEEPSQNNKATFTWISQNVLVPKCTSCHGGSRPESGIGYDSYSKTLSTVRVGDAARSTLYKIISRGEMPPGRDDVTAEQLQAIFDWIQAGAPNN